MLLGDPPQVSPKGPISSCRICFVAGCPSAAEWNNRGPMVGRTGDMFDELCKTAGIQLKECYYTFVIKHYSRSQKNTINFRRTGAVDVSPQYITYEAELKEELSLCSANVFVPLDDIALYALCRETSVSKYRSSILPSTLLPGRKVIPTLTPASAWSQYLFRHYLVHDLVRIRKDSLSPELDIPSPNLIIEPTYDECISYMQECYNSPLIAFDIETSRGELDCFSLSHSGNDGICIPLIKNMKPYFALEDEANILVCLAKLLHNPLVAKVLQNGIYDATFLYERYGMVIHNVEDTMIAHGLLLPDFPKSLAFMASTYTRYPYYKDEGKMRFKGFQTDDRRFWRYSALDSIVTLEVWHGLSKDLSTTGLTPTYDSHIAIIHPLIQMQYLGNPVSPEALRGAAEAIDKKVSELQQSLEAICGYPLNPNSPKQLCEYFYGVKKLKPYLKDKKPTTDVTAMQRLMHRGYKEAEIIVRIRRLRKFSSTYLKVKLDENNLLRGSYNPIGTNTGRLSSSKHILGFGCNRQNIPKRGELSLYPYILQRNGYIPYSVDLSGAENRIVAYYGPVPAMIAAFESGKDVHRLTASLLFNIPYSEVSDEPGSAGIMGSDKSQRDMGKMFNHSGNYGVGAPTLALKNDMPLAPVKQGLETYHAIYPEVRQQFQTQIVNQLRDNNRTVMNCLGRTRKFLDRWGDSLFQDAWAFPAQSTIADIINRRGLSYIYNTPSLRELHITNQIHDSIEFEISSHHPWLFHARCIRLLIDSLEQPLTWQARTFSIPCDLELRRYNFSLSRKIKSPDRNPWKLSTQLSLAYESIRCI